MTENKPKPGNSDIPASLTAAVVACVALRDLVRIRQLYPNALSDDDADELHQSLVEHLRAALGHERFDDIRETLYREMKLDSSVTEVELSVLFTVLVAQCPNVRFTEDDADATRESIQGAVSACQQRVSSPLKDDLAQLIEIKLYDCRIPEGSSSFADPRRSMQLLRSYWSLCRSLVIHQIDACLFSHPHPLLRLILNLRLRIDAYFEQLVDVEGSREAIEAVKTLMDVVVSNEPDDLSAVPEYAHELLQTVDAFLEQARIKSGSKIFPLTHEEKIFLAHAEEAIDHYHKYLDTTWIRMCRRASNDQVKKHGGNKNGGPLPIPSPTLARPTRADVNTGLADGPAAMVDNRPQQAYCRSITQQGRRLLSKTEYEILVKSKSEYDMFIDGMTGHSLCRENRATPRTAKLTPKELGILIDLIQADRPIRPSNTNTGGACLSPASACRLFEQARRKVDVKLGRYKYRAFRLHKSPSNRNLKAFEFVPPDDLRYCVIVPV
jgi:hypothetical protein